MFCLISYFGFLVIGHCTSPQLSPQTVTIVRSSLQTPAELKMTPAFDLSSDASRHKVTTRVKTYAATAP